MPDTPVLPSWRYRVTGEARVITTVDELTALEPGEWFESPQAAAEAAHAAAAASAEEPPPPRSRR